MKNLKLLIGFVLFFSIASTSCTKESNLYYEDEPVGNGNQGSDEAITLYKVINGQVAKVKDFEVSANLQIFQADIEKHQAMWNFFTKLVPAD